MIISFSKTSDEYIVRLLSSKCILLKIIITYKKESELTVIVTVVLAVE